MSSVYARALISFVFGSLTVLSFAPFGWWPICFVTVGLLFYQCRLATPRASFWSGLAFGYGLFGFGVSWVYVSLHTYGGMPLWMGTIAVLGFAGLLALFIAMPLYLASRISPQGGSQRLLVLAFLWVIFEWLKSWVLTGFPWLELGHSQSSSVLFGLAPIGGSYLVSMFVTLIAASSVVAICDAQLRFRALGLFITMLVLSVLSDGLRWSQAVGQPVEVAVVQPNIPIGQKWQVQQRDAAINKLASKSYQLHADKAVQLFVWPETALPLYRQQTDADFWRSITPPGSSLLTGIMDSPNPQESYNAAVLNCAGDLQVYRKRHLVPFGEYLPLRFLFNWVLEYLQLPMSDFTAWQGPQALRCGENLNLGLSICYEDAFGSELRQSVGDATMLVNISEDAWFGDSLAPHQRLQIAQMRARELARPLLRSANTGPSVLIDELGKVQARTDQFVETTLRVSVQAQQGDTPYKKYGNWIIWLAFVIVLSVVGINRRGIKTSQ